ncbi:MAG: helix-turn-helix transcriptional regulator [Candidatus Shapirobacteria bacterium]
MKRNINQLTKWTEFDKKLVKKPKLFKDIAKSEAMYQLTRSLISLRLDKKLSQSELAIKIGSKQPAISRLESGNSWPSFSLLQKIAIATNSKLTINFL